MEPPFLILSDSTRLVEQCGGVADYLFHEFSENIRLSVNDRVLATHQIRKKLKNFRSFVKLLKFCKNKINYSDPNSELRDWGKEFSRLRDVHVRDEILRELISNPAMKSFKKTVKKLYRMNHKLVIQLESEMITEQNLFGKFQAEINRENTVRDFMEYIIPAADDILSGFINSYHESYDAFSITSGHPTPDSLHEWRKRMKDVQFQLSLLMNDIPSSQLPDPEIVNMICDNLGRDHDLFMLTEWIKQADREKNKDSEHHVLITELKSTQAQIQNSTNQLGFKLYEFTPQQAEESLTSYLHA